MVKIIRHDPERKLISVHPGEFCLLGEALIFVTSVATTHEAGTVDILVANVKTGATFNMDSQSKVIPVDVEIKIK